MKAAHLFLLFCLALCTSACFKEKIKPDAPIVGRWQETKARVYLLNHSGDISRDTTYLQFNLTDYAVFNSNGGCQLNSTRILNPAGGSANEVSQNIARWSLSYTAIASKFVLSSYGTVTRDTVSMSDNSTIRIHSVLDNNLFYTISDVWYTKVDPKSIK